MLHGYHCFLPLIKCNYKHFNFNIFKLKKKKVKRNNRNKWDDLSRTSRNKVCWVAKKSLTVLENRTEKNNKGYNKLPWILGIESSILPKQRSMGDTSVSRLCLVSFIPTNSLDCLLLNIKKSLFVLLNRLRHVMTFFTIIYSIYAIII